MATSREVYNRIRWDARFDARRFVIGYRERGREELAEKPLDEWDGTIPWHRVHYFKLGTERVWDRESGVDRITSGEALALAAAPREEGTFAPLPVFDWQDGEWKPAAPGERKAKGDLPLRLLAWNVLSDRHDPGTPSVERRFTAVLETLRARDADLLALAEVSPRFLERLLAEPWIRAAYRTTDRTGETLAAEGVLVLARFGFDASSHRFENGKRIVVARTRVAGRALTVAALHLTSDRAPDARRKRADELGRLVTLLASPSLVEEDVVVLGDLNVREEDPGGLRGQGLRDVWRALRGGEPGFTYDPATNALAGRTTGSGEPARFDRVLHRARALEAVSIERLNAAAPEPASDHEGLVVELSERATLDAAPGLLSALAVLPPEELRPAIDAIRREHDPAFERWMPHVNLLYGFVPASRFREAAELVASAVRDAVPFTVVLRHFDVFEHSRSATVHLVAESEPAGALERLRGAVAERFEPCARRPYSPHLTVGRFDDAETARAHAAAFERDWRPLRFAARSVALLARGEETPFAVARSVELGGSLERWLAEHGARESAPEAARRERALASVRAACVALDARAELHVSGSTRLGVALPTSDLDLVSVLPGLMLEGLDLQAFARALEEKLGVLVTPATDARTPLVRLTLEALTVEVALAAPGPDALAPCRASDEIARAASLHVAPEDFRVVLRAVRAWARGRRLDSQAWGFAGGAAWALLVAWAVEGAERDSPPERLLAHVLERAAAESWPAPVAEAARSLTAGTRKELEAELARAVEVVERVLAGVTTWDELVEPVSLAASFRHVARLAVEAGLEASAEAARGQLARRALGLVQDLEHARGVRAVRPAPSRGTVRIGLALDDPEVARSVLARFAAELERAVPGARLAWSLG